MIIAFLTSLLVSATTLIGMPDSIIQLPQYLPIAALAGLAGGVTRWVRLREKMWPDGLSSAITGLFAASFLWPIGQPIIEGITGRLQLDPITSVLFGAYITGLLGVTVIGAILDLGVGKKARAAIQPEDFPHE